MYHIAILSATLNRRNSPVSFIMPVNCTPCWYRTTKQGRLKNTGLSMIENISSVTMYRTYLWHYPHRILPYTPFEFTIPELRTTVNMKDDEAVKYGMTFAVINYGRLCRTFFGHIDLFDIAIHTRYELVMPVFGTVLIIQNKPAV